VYDILTFAPSRSEGTGRLRDKCFGVPNTSESQQNPAWIDIMGHGWLGLSLILVTISSDSQAVFLRNVFDNWYSNNARDGINSVCAGACQLSMTCWMNGGTPQGSCGGMVYICCVFSNSSNTRQGQQTYAQPRKLDFWDDFEVNNVEVLHDISFGPVRNDPVCGLQRISRRRVVGGRSAGFGVYPWQALVLNQNSRCGGALVSRQHVVTAGHCVSNYTDAYKQPRGVKVYLGEYNLLTEQEPLPMQRRIVTKIYVHPYYRFSPQADRYDVAVLKLDRPIQYAPHIVPICLPQKNEFVSEGTEAMVSGWGARDPNSDKRPKYLQAVDVKVIETKRCEDWHRDNKIQLTMYEDMMCAGHKEGKKDACQGDSGGPLMTKREDGRWSLIGVVSSGYSCAKPKQPGIYHRVAKSSDWISYVTRFLRD